MRKSSVALTFEESSTVTEVSDAEESGFETVNECPEGGASEDCDVGVVVSTCPVKNEFPVAAEDTSSQSSNSKGNSENEVASLVENLNVESDHFEKISSETVDIASLMTNSEYDDNENGEVVERSDEPEAASEVVHRADTNRSADPESSPVFERAKWGENKRRQSLMMKYALKNSLESSAMDILNRNVGDLIKTAANGYAKTDTSLLEPPEKDMYAWASSCANLNPVGPRFKLMKEGDVQVCYLDHTRTVLSKILSFKFLRHFELHHLHLHESKISPKNVSVFNVS